MLTDSFHLNKSLLTERKCYAQGPHGPVYSSSAAPNPHMPFPVQRLAEAPSEYTEIITEPQLK
jgi:hypothetical protein